jgi:hypothetical protein
VADNSGNGSLDVSPNLDQSHTGVGVTNNAPVTESPSTLNDATTALPVNVSDLTGTVNGLTSQLTGGSPNGLGL